MQVYSIVVLNYTWVLKTIENIKNKYLLQNRYWRTLISTPWDAGACEDSPS